MSSTTIYVNEVWIKKCIVAGDVIYDLAFWQNQIKMRDDCAVRYSIRVLRDVVVLSVHSREFINYVNPLSKCHVIYIHASTKTPVGRESLLSIICPLCPSYTYLSNHLTLQINNTWARFKKLIPAQRVFLSGPHHRYQVSFRRKNPLFFRS